MYIYDHMRQGFKREDKHERRDDDMRSKTISYGRKKHITSREGKRERNISHLGRGKKNERCHI